MKFYDSKEVNTSTQRLQTQRTESIGGNISSRNYFEDKNFFEVLEIVVDSVARATFIVLSQFVDDRRPIVAILSHCIGLEKDGFTSLEVLYTCIATQPNRHGILLVKPADLDYKYGVLLLDARAIRRKSLTEPSRFY